MYVILCLHTYMHTYIHTDIHIHTYLHTYVHTYKRTYIHMYMQWYVKNWDTSTALLSFMAGRAHGVVEHPRIRNSTALANLGTALSKQDSDQARMLCPGNRTPKE